MWRQARAKNVLEGFSDEVFQSYQTRRAAYETSSRPLYDMLRWHARHVHLKEVADCNLVLTRALLVKLMRSPCDLRSGWKAVARRRGATVFLAEVVDTAAAGVRADHRVLWSGLRFQEVCTRGAGDAHRADAKQMAVVPVSLFTPCGTRLSLLVVSGVDCLRPGGTAKLPWLGPGGTQQWLDMACTQWKENSRRPGQPFLAPQKALEYILKLQVLEIPSMALTRQVRSRISRHACSRQLRLRR